MPGRPRTRPHPGLVGPGVPHLRRPDFAARHPVHVTMRLQPGVGYLRTYQRAKVVEDALRGGARAVRRAHHPLLHPGQPPAPHRRGARVQAALSRGHAGARHAAGAKRLNELSGRRGGVFADRYHAHPLKTPREAKHAVRYVLTNYRHHALEYLPAGWTDPLASARFTQQRPGGDAPVVAPSVWLLRVGWRL